MTREDFENLIDYMIDTYGVRSYRMNDEENDLWFECAECGEPILFDDWENDEELENGYCPVCGERLVEEEE